MEKIIYKIEGLDCQEEVSLIRKAFGSASGIIDLQFSVLDEKLTVIYDPRKIKKAEIVQKIKSTGMKPVLEGVQNHQETQTLIKNRLRLSLVLLSGFFLILATLFRFIFSAGWTDFFKGGPVEVFLSPLVKWLYFFSILSAVILVLPKAWRSIKQLSLDMNVLMIVAITGAIVINEWFEAATVAFLFALALLLEKWSVARARRAVSSLLELSPKVGRVKDLNTNEWKERNIEDIAIGDYVLVRPFEKIPIDGYIVSGSSSINQAAITGESLPIFKNPGEEVFSGTLNQEGAITCYVTKEVDNTTLAKMLRLIDEARQQRSESEMWVEKFAKYYTPLMLLFSLFVMTLPPLFFGANFTDWFYRGLVLLVIACPCALVISTPVSIVSGLTSAAKEGFLIKGGIFLEEVGKLKALCLDKTGTLTYGHPRVEKIVAFDGHTEGEIIMRAATLESPSEHPLARAILSRAEQMGITVEMAENYQSVKGKGALATYKSKLYWIGSHRFMHEMGQETPLVHQKALEMEDAAHSVIALGNDAHVCGLISLADEPRKSVKEIIEEIRTLGIHKIVMLTGDNEPTAKALADLSGIKTYFFELLPEEKLEKVTTLIDAYGKVGMVGDGVNDAPAMARATVGFAMAAMGTDVAIETADIALMSDDLAKLPWLIRHSRKVLKIIQQNISISVGIKGLFIALAFLNLTTLWMAIAADTGATMLVISNALRLLKRSR